MKLYRSNNGRWFGTQADAKAAVGKHNFGERDVPTDKWGLIGWLNNEATCRGEPAVQIAAEPEMLPPHTLVSDPRETPADYVQPSPNVFDKVMRNIDIDEAIMDATFAEAVRIAGQANSRVAEHLKSIADAHLPKPSKGYGA